RYRRTVICRVRCPQRITANEARPLLQFENFDLADATGAVLIAHDSGVANAGCEVQDDCRLEIVRRRLTGRQDCGFLSIPPIIVGSDYCALAVEDQNGRIRQRIRDTGPGKRWTERTN